MSEPDAELKAETPEHVRKVGGGTTENTDVARQADTAWDENTKDQILVTMERVLCRENMLQAYQRVVSNAGAPGADGMTVEQLKPWLQARWEAVRKELLDVLRRLLERMRPILLGWVSYFRKSQVRITFEELDAWIRRTLRAILWRQWKRPRTRARELIRRGLDPKRAWTSAMNGHGPWWNAGASHMNQTVPTRFLHQLGLRSLVHESQRMLRST